MLWTARCLTVGSQKPPAKLVSLSNRSAQEHHSSMRWTFKAHLSLQKRVGVETFLLSLRRYWRAG